MSPLPPLPLSPMAAPGNYLPNAEFWDTPKALLSLLRWPWAAVVDMRVLSLHPRLRPLLSSMARPFIEVRAGETAKSVSCFERIAKQLQSLPRGATLLAIGGGTIGDLCTVLAHTLKRGMRLWHWPTTWLAAIDSSVGGKGALNLGGIKNVLGAFHYPEGSLICPALFETLTAEQKQEGLCEAWKMATCLSVKHFNAWTKAFPKDEALVKQARELKAKVCEEDPYELSGRRAVLNFGHSFGHVIESVSGYKIRHGRAVGMGLWCALDIGRHLGVTPPSLAEEIEEVWTKAKLPGRGALARALARCSDDTLQKLLWADKKNKATQSLRMVLLKDLGKTELREVYPEEWKPLAACWRKGDKP